MKKKLMALLLSVLLCGCQSLPAGSVKKETKSEELILAVPVGSGSICYEAAQELARRAVDFAENTLSVTVVMEENIWTALESGKADIAVCENSRLVQDGEALGKVLYPAAEESSSVAGSGAMFAMLEYPYFFRDADCVINGANDADFLAALNYSLPEEFPMELKRLSYCGSYHWLVNDYEIWDTYFTENSMEDVLTAQLSLGYSIRDVWNYYNDRLALQEVDLTADELDVGDQTVLLSGSRQQILDIFVNPSTTDKLDREQKAALEEAVVYCGGYSRTLADSRMKQALNALEESGVSIQKDADAEQWYEAFQELYLSGNYEVNAELAELLRSKTERFH